MFLVQNFVVDIVRADRVAVAAAEYCSFTVFGGGVNDPLSSRQKPPRLRALKRSTRRGPLRH